MAEPALNSGQVYSPSCPRCGYDMSGAVAAWQSLCPLEGTCPECGMVFEWRYLLNPRLRIPSWSFEHAKSGLVRAGLVTMARSRWPSRFWRLLPVEAPIVESRLREFRLHSVLVAWIGSGLVSLALIVAQTFLGGNGFYYRYVGRSLLTQLADAREMWAVVFPIGSLDHWNRQVLTPDIVVALAWTLVFPATLALLPQTRKQFRVRPAQLARIRAYADWRAIAACSVPAWMRLIGLHAWWNPYVSRELIVTAIGMVLPILLVGWFWWRGLGRYLKLPHAAGIVLINGLLALIMSIFIAGLFGALVGFDWLFEPLPHL